jgi:hypothetical protein
MTSVKLPGGKRHCNLCSVSVRETLWSSHERDSGHRERLAAWENEQETPSSSSSSDEETHEFQKGERSTVKMPELVPIRTSMISEFDEVTALELTSSNPGDSLPNEFFDQTPPVEQSSEIEDRRLVIENTMQEGFDRLQVKKQRMRHDDDDDDDDWRSRSI